MATKTNTQEKPATEKTDSTLVVSSVNEISKITMASIGTNPGACHTHPAKRAPLARIYGIASKTKDKVDKNLELSYTEVHGDFEAINLQTGETFRSGRLFLPQGLHEKLIAAIIKDKDDSGNSDVRFALDIYSVPSNNPVKYSYLATPIVSPENYDAMSTVRGTMPALPQGSAKQLAASN